MKRLTDYEDYQAAANRLNELHGELSDLERERDQIYIELNSHRNTRENALDVKARALLSGDTETQTETLEAKYSAICQRIEVLQRAVNMQRSKAESLRARYSEEINQQAEKEYLPLLRKAVDAAVAASKAFSAAMQYRDALEADGVIVTLPRLDSLNRFGRWENTNAHIHHVIKEATEAGIIKPGTYDQPQQPGPYDRLTRPIETISAGPAGVSKVQVSKGGSVRVLKQSYVAPKPDNSQTAWTN